MLTLSKFIASGNRFRLSLIRSMCYTLFQSRKVISSKGSELQCAPAVKIILTNTINVIYKNTVSSHHNSSSIAIILCVLFKYSSKILISQSESNMAGPLLQIKMAASIRERLVSLLSTTIFPGQQSIHSVKIY